MIAEITAAKGNKVAIPIVCRIDTLDELEYFRNGGILHYVLRNLAAARAGASSITAQTNFREWLL